DARPETTLTSALIEVDLPRALRRSEPALTDRVPRLLARRGHDEIDETIRTAAAGYTDHELRSLDAIHLATVGSVAVVHPDGLRLRVGVDRPRPHLPAPAGRLVTTPRCGHVRDGRHVHEDRTRADTVREPVRGFDVAGPHGSGQSVLRVVGSGDQVVQLVTVLVTADREDRPEDLLVHDGHVVVDAGEQGGRVEVTVAGAGFTTCDHLGALAAARLYQVLHVVTVLGRHERAELGRFVGTGPHSQRGEPRGHLVDELLLALGIDIEPSVGSTHLTTLESGPSQVALHGCVDVGFRSEEHTSELQSRLDLVCRPLRVR